MPELVNVTPLAVTETKPLAAPQLLDALRPAERVELMAEISNVVKDVIEKQKWFAPIQGKKHILIQGWTFIGGLGGCSAKVVSTEQIDGGFKARAVVVRVDTGIEVGSAEQVCMKSEKFGRGKDDYALIGMASTRASSRALSTVFRHVVELAGYSATPAEEMVVEAAPLPIAEPPPPANPSPTDKMLERMVALDLIGGAGERAQKLQWAKEYADDHGIEFRTVPMNEHMEAIEVERARKATRAPNTEAMRRKARALFAKLGYDDDARRDAYEGICGEGVRSWSDVVAWGMAGKVLDHLEAATKDVPA